MKVSIVIPAKDEEVGLGALLPKLVEQYPEAEIIVVNDGSTDNTLEVCNKYDIDVITHPYSKGNGASIKSGARKASGDILVFMDADGQHLPTEVGYLIETLEEGYDMVVGARERATHASTLRYIANSLYNKLATYMSGHKIMDLTSGFRAVRADIFRKYLYLLPNGFSYPTSITMALFRSGYSIKYAPITCKKRIGKSHIKLLKDGFRFLLIIFRITSLYSPLKIFTPLSLLFFFTGTFYYFYTYLLQGRFTNMSTLLLIISVLIFLFGLLSEQLTVLMYSNKNNDD